MQNLNAQYFEIFEDLMNLEEPRTFSSVAVVPKFPPLSTQPGPVLKCWMVLGCSHITVFIAGANMKGLSGSQALKKHVAKLS